MVISKAVMAYVNCSLQGITRIDTMLMTHYGCDCTANWVREPSRLPLQQAQKILPKWVSCMAFIKGLIILAKLVS